MKSVILACSIAVSGIAHADISKEAGRCAAYMLLVKKSNEDARIAMNHAENKGKMQVAANQWVDLAQSNPSEAVKQAQMACIYHLRMKM
jgi:hypothetical protein